MKAKIFIVIVLLFGFSAIYSQNDLEISNEYPEAKKEVKKALDEIEQSIRDNEVDKLISMHAYGPKFTEFQNGEKRQGSEENENFERNFLGTITEIEKWEWEDLKINIYGGDVANVTFHYDLEFKRGEESYDLKMQGALLFIKTNDGWKITHEHMAPLTETKNRPETPEKTHISKSDFPKGNMINYVEGWGGMVVAINEPPAGTDFAPLLIGQKDDLCQVPHWGYLEKGKLQAKYKDRPTEIISKGEVFYMPPGHTAKVIEDARIIDFSPEEEMMELMEDIDNKVYERKN
ncbi:SnoaL-like domain-containing protein [Salegentibacter holothuriorum]|uniref:SnoaL-like domain-containing protein n=2 Tax=Salegentibacter holothuriorum TaxID=241145 RepID=A0A1T5BIT3_9FLAO|nr:SnoaL-like domain-containing protein [Salegentibacter holothuriorum]